MQVQSAQKIRSIFLCASGAGRAPNTYTSAGTVSRKGKRGRVSSARVAGPCGRRGWNPASGWGRFPSKDTNIDGMQYVRLASIIQSEIRKVECNCALFRRVVSPTIAPLCVELGLNVTLNNTSIDNTTARLILTGDTTVQYGDNRVGSRWNDTRSWLAAVHLFVVIVT